MCSCDFFLGMLALLFPPLPVWVKRGICSADSIINILLCLLGYVSLSLSLSPCSARVFWLLTRHSSRAWFMLDAEGSIQNRRFTYIVVQPSGGRPQPQPQTAAPEIQSNMNYGTTAPAAASSSSAQQPRNDAGEGGSNGPPPSYAQAVSSDNKIQNHD
ncbi:stress response RCI peptide [Grosmannia clavigera kw1407]|uniref:Stress response RCI peptide n=1 Tax=Grosmannia clavigera (strain kw1407 / UAMH 11150) TaxID=655863 RepID=F0X8B8_GROCL|nr:stress response RCI peptide [Grosmannia clavigera kw1407]EFX05318.1 stress response RCI peptide [Grosmannia clavigera kw1407]